MPITNTYDTLRAVPPPDLRGSPSPDRYRRTVSPLKVNVQDEDYGDEDTLEITPAAGNRVSPMGDYRSGKRLLRSPGGSPPGSPRASPPIPEPPFTTRCPVMSWHSAWDSTFLARRHNQSRVEPIKDKHQWFSASFRDRNLPCAPLSERKRTASYHAITLGSPYGGPQTYLSPRIPKWDADLRELGQGSTRRTKYARQYGKGPSSQRPLIPMPPDDRQRAKQQQRGSQTARSPSPGKQRLYSPDPVIVNDVHKPERSFFSRSHQHWPEPTKTPDPEDQAVATEKNVTGVPLSSWSPHHKSYWEQPQMSERSLSPTKLQKRPAWYSNMYGTCKPLVRNC